MAHLNVEPKKNDDRWKWILLILAGGAILWIVIEATGADDAVDDVDDIETTTTQNLTTSFIEPDKWKKARVV